MKFAYYPGCSLEVNSAAYDISVRAISGPEDAAPTEICPPTFGFVIITISDLLAAWQPVGADNADSAVAPEHNELLDAEYARQILSDEAIDGMAA